MKKLNFSEFALDAKGLKQIKGGEETADLEATAILITDPIRKKDKKR